MDISDKSVDEGSCRRERFYHSNLQGELSNATAEINETRRARHTRSYDVIADERRVHCSVHRLLPLHFNIPADLGVVLKDLRTRR